MKLGSLKFLGSIKLITFILCNILSHAYSQNELTNANTAPKFYQHIRRESDNSLNENETVSKQLATSSDANKSLNNHEQVNEIEADYSSEGQSISEALPLLVTDNKTMNSIPNLSESNETITIKEMNFETTYINDDLSSFPMNKSLPETKTSAVIQSLPFYSKNESLFLETAQPGVSLSESGFLESNSTVPDSRVVDDISSASDYSSSTDNFTSGSTSPSNTSDYSKAFTIDDLNSTSEFSSSTDNFTSDPTSSSYSSEYSKAFTIDDLNSTSEYSSSTDNFTSEFTIDDSGLTTDIFKNYSVQDEILNSSESMNLETSPTIDSFFTSSMVPFISEPENSYHTYEHTTTHEAQIENQDHTDTSIDNLDINKQSLSTIGFDSVSPINNSTEFETIFSTNNTYYAIDGISTDSVFSYESENFNSSTKFDNFENIVRHSTENDFFSELPATSENNQNIVSESNYKDTTIKGNEFLPTNDNSSMENMKTDSSNDSIPSTPSLFTEEIKFPSSTIIISDENMSVLNNETHPTNGKAVAGGNSNDDSGHFVSNPTVNQEEMNISASNNTFKSSYTTSTLSTPQINSPVPKIKIITRIKLENIALYVTNRKRIEIDAIVTKKFSNEITETLLALNATNARAEWIQEPLDSGNYSMVALVTFENKFPVISDANMLEDNANSIILRAKEAIRNKISSKKISQITSNKTGVQLSPTFDSIKASFITYHDKKAQPDEFNTFYKNKYMLSLLLMILCSVGMIVTIVIVKSCQNFAYLRYKKKKFGMSTLELISSDFFDKNSEKGQPKITKVQCTLNPEKLNDEVNLDTESKNKTKKDSSRQLNIYNYLKPRNSVLNKFAINQNPIYENIYDTIPNNNVKASEVNKEFIKLEPLKPN